MNEFTALLGRSAQEIEGSFHTAHEIAQQPELWAKVLDLLERRQEELKSFMAAAGMTGTGSSAALLAGAGSSAFVGASIAATLRERLGRDVQAVPTTDLVTHPQSPFCANRTYAVVHFARSGDSPESVAAWRLVSAVRPDASHLVITCNPDGALHREAARRPGALSLLLPVESNDRSLAMTSSFTSMALCGIGLGFIADPGRLREHMRSVVCGTQRIIENYANLLAELGERPYSKACYLGSHALAGAMQEGALKMLEMTAGAVTTASNSFLGIRHGPRVFIDESCLVVACLSSQEKVRRYELDLLRDLRERGQAAGILALSVGDDPEIRALADHCILIAPDGNAILDELRVLTDIVACQLLAFFAARSRGLMPDSPSPDGVISRVVQGVRIYE
jgi:tagatose-6-phosphate ketose/aldose isomerase